MSPIDGVGPARSPEEHAPSAAGAAVPRVEVPAVALSAVTASMAGAEPVVPVDSVSVLPLGTVLTTPEGDVRPAVGAVPDLAVVAAVTADVKQGDRTVVLEMGSLLAVTEAFVVTAGRNRRHVQAIVEEIEAGGKRLVGRAPLRIEGLGDLQWVLMDYGDVVVHVFDIETRAVYDLERLWGDAPRVDWQAAAGPVR